MKEQDWGLNACKVGVWDNPAVGYGLGEGVMGISVDEGIYYAESTETV